MPRSTPAHWRPEPLQPSLGLLHPPLNSPAVRRSASPPRRFIAAAFNDGEQPLVEAQFALLDLDERSCIGLGGLLVAGPPAHRLARGGVIGIGEGLVAGPAAGVTGDDHAAGRQRDDLVVVGQSRFDFPANSRHVTRPLTHAHVETKPMRAPTILMTAGLNPGPGLNGPRLVKAS